ncbi:DsbA family protein [Psychromonas hadalis]|uniref:DsbA family protein n=1 Tax=Psychromonas hadalis TaxID=211669 RepID=UPI0003B4A671|nr:DsbA family protein [Psychromonas hadalis]
MKPLCLSKNVLSTSIATIILVSSIIATSMVSAVTISTAQQQQQIREISELLQQNPDVIEGLHANLSQYIDGQSSITNTLKLNHDYLYNNPLHPYFGAQDAKLTVINFTDYNCPYCKRLESGLAEVIKNYPDVRIVNVYLPFQQRMIPGMQTNTAWYALDVWENNRDNFAEVHRLMMAKPSRHDKNSIMKIANMTNSQGSLLANQQKKEMVEKNEQIFAKLGLRGTPSLIIGSEIIPGFIPQSQLEALIEAQLK